MTTITLSEIKAAQDHLASLIAKFEAAAVPAVSTTLIVPEAQIELRPGEVYAGLVLTDAGLPSHHLVLLPGQAEDVTWEAAKAWAKDVGGELPTCPEAALLYANAKSHFEDRWYWCAEEYSDRFAWFQNFLNGGQNGDAKSAELRARAVRLIQVDA